MNTNIISNHAPSPYLPCLGGECYKSGTIQMDFHPPFEPPLNAEVYFTSPTDIVTFPIGFPNYVRRAIDSDVVKSETSLLSTIGFIQRGSQIYSRINDEQKKHYGRLLALNFEPSLRHMIEEEMPAKKESLRTACNLTVPPSINVLSQSIQRFMTNGFQGGKLVAESLVTLAIVQALRALDKNLAKKSQTLPSLNKRTLSDTLDFIESNLDRNIGLEDIAGAAAISIFHFSRCFKNAVGKTPYSYLIERRIERAKNLLIYTNRQLSDIALTCGFSSQSHLSTLFKKTTGIAPSRYRMEAR